LRQQFGLFLFWPGSEFVLTPLIEPTVLDFCFFFGSLLHYFFGPSVLLGASCRALNRKGAVPVKSPKTTRTKSLTAKPNALRTWKQFEDHLIPRLRLSVIDRAVYSHLLRHSRLEGKRRLRFSILELARRARISGQPVRDSVRRLIAHDVLRLIERTNKGHLVEVRLPHEVRAACPEERRVESHGAKPLRPHFRLEQADFFKDYKLRSAIHAREGGLCFYCRKKMANLVKCLDHVVPRVVSGRNSYRNLVSCCTDCNSQKNDQPAADFLRRLYREQRLTAPELEKRFAALRDLISGKLVPPLAG
jgi:5-methylcytosine-specific restriction endonuclease McrA